jgi:hypothetical protein
MQAITNYDVYRNGTYGYIVRIDFSNYDIDTISFLTAYDSSTLESVDAVSSETALVTIMDYPKEDDCPELAWNFTANILTVFLKTGDSYYTYDSSTKIGIYGYQYPSPLKSEDDYVDIPFEYVELLFKYIIREAGEILGKIIPESVQQNIKNLEAEI